MSDSVTSIDTIIGHLTYKLTSLGGTAQARAVNTLERLAYLKVLMERGMSEQEARNYIAAALREQLGEGTE